MERPLHPADSMKNNEARPRKATDLLQEQHREIESLFRRLTATGNGARAQLVDHLVALLQLHTRLEETYFYPAIRRLDTRKAEDAVLESIEEHEIVDHLLSRLPALDIAGERFLTSCRVLQSVVERHLH